LGTQLGDGDALESVVLVPPDCISSLDVEAQRVALYLMLLAGPRSSRIQLGD
jgi:hypothetical protein